MACIDTNKYRYRPLKMAPSYMIACRCGYLRVLKEEYGKNPNDIDLAKAYKAALMNGHVHVIEWLIQTSPKIDPRTDLFVEVCGSGHINAAKWMKSYVNVDDHASDAFHQACVDDHIDIAQWLLNEYPDIYVFGYTYSACNLDTIKWFLSKFPDVSNYTFFNKLYRKSDRDVVQWFLDERNPSKLDIASIWEIISMNGNLDSIKWFHEMYPYQKYFEIFDRTCAPILMRDTDVLEWFLGISRDYYLSNRNPIDRVVLPGILGTFEYMIRCTLINHVTKESWNRHLECIFKNICECGDLHACKRVVDSYDISNITAMMPVSSLVHACKSGNVELVQWMIDDMHFTDIYDNDCATFRVTCSYNRVMLAKWLYEKYPNVRVYAPDVIRLVCTDGSLETLKWLLETFDELDIYANNHTLFQKIHHCQREILEYLTDLTMHNSIKYYVAGNHKYIISDAILNIVAKSKGVCVNHVEIYKDMYVYASDSAPMDSVFKYIDGIAHHKQSKSARMIV